MVLEWITNAKHAEQKPWNVFFLGMLYATIALFLSLWVFSSHASLVMVFLTVLASLLLVEAVLKLEEEKDRTDTSEMSLLKEHSKGLLLFLFLFFGFVIAFAFWYTVLPAETVQQAFSLQMKTISDINKITTGFDQTMQAAAISKEAIFSRILLNNMKVLVFCLIFSFFYGSGALFILSWNASVIGVATGNIVRSNLAALTSSFGLTNITTYFTSFSLGILKYMTHGVFEIAAYFIAAMGAGIISIAVINKEYRTNNFSRIARDSGYLIGISVLVLILAGFIEVYFTPLLF